jgi:predicted RNA binding protein YcfA (HicA-like mRNA interferase family)
MKSADIIKRLESEGWTWWVKNSDHQFKLAGKGLVTVKHPDSDIPIVAQHLSASRMEMEIV